MNHLFKDKVIFNAGAEAVREYFQGIPVRTDRSEIKVKVSPFIPAMVPLELYSKNMNGIIESYSYSKTRTNPYGVWNITMAADDNYALENHPIGEAMQSLWAATGRSLRDLMKPSAYSQLWHNGYHIMSGKIRAFKRKKSADGKKTYNAEFHELSQIYDQEIMQFQSVQYGAEKHYVNDPTKVTEAAAKLTGVPLPQAIERAVGAFLLSTMSFGSASWPHSYFRMSDGLPVTARMVALPPPLGGISYSSLISQYVSGDVMFSDNNAGTTMWDYLKQMAPEPWMELFTESGGRTICTGRGLVGKDVGSISKVTGFTPSSVVGFSVPGLNVSTLLPGMNYIIARTSPYSNPMLGGTSWDSILSRYLLDSIDLIAAGDFIIITDEDIVEKELGVSDYQQYTLFFANLKGGKNAYKGRPSISHGPFGQFGVMPGGIKTYGARSYSASFPSTAIDWQGLVGKSLEKVKGESYEVPALTTLLNYWFRNASKFVEGNVVTRPIPYARPGMMCLYLPTITGKVDDPRDLGIYYIDSVETSGQISGNGSTSMKLIRGIPIPSGIESVVSYLVDWEIGIVTSNLAEDTPSDIASAGAGGVAGA